MEFDSSLIILDDQKARRLAEKLHLNYTGTLGILVRAKESGIIAQVKPFLEKIQATNFRLSDTVFLEVLKLTNE
ncbi:MAG: DUF3368 domain-containing protein [Chitinophagaceae bacterium]|nr:DUF3368 domain-containing protein [Chitinophagaceae bacterium]